MGQVVDAVARLGSPDAVIVSDVGQNQMFAARYSRFGRSGKWVASGGLGTMGFGLPAAIGAKIANPDSPVQFGQMWSSGIEARDQQYGTRTGYVVPEVGVPMAIESVAIVNGTDTPEEAKRFVDWFGAADLQGRWAQQFSTLPANVNAVGMANDFNKVIAELPAQDIDWGLVAENIDAWCEKIILTYMQ